MTVSVAKKIAIILGSTRTPRLSPSIGAHVEEVLKKHAAPGAATFSILDIKEYNLGFYDDAKIPMLLPAEDTHLHYSNEQSRKWSAAVAEFDAYIFVTPQYNWSIPAALKNALDILFQEFTTKPAAIISFGGRGGAKAAEHLFSVCQGLRMKPLDKSVNITINPRILADVKDNKLPEVEVVRYSEEGYDKKIEELYDDLIAAFNKNE